MTFLKNNWFKLAILLLAIVVVSFWFSRKDAKREVAVNPDTAMNAYNCSQSAKDIDEQERVYNGAGRKVYTSNHFNEKDGKCYVYTEAYDIKGTSSNSYNFVYSKMWDGYEKKTIFQCGAGTFITTLEDGGECTEGGSRNDANFKEQYRRYFLD